MKPKYYWGVKIRTRLDNKKGPPSLHYQLVDSSIFLYLSKQKPISQLTRDVLCYAAKLCFDLDRKHCQPQFNPIPNRNFLSLKMYNKVINLYLIPFVVWFLVTAIYVGPFYWLKVLKILENISLTSVITKLNQLTSHLMLGSSSNIND